MTTLTDLIPHTGHGVALFPFLNEQELERLKTTCKTLKGDVESHMERWGTSPPPLALQRVEGRLMLRVEGATFDAVAETFAMCQEKPRKYGSWGVFYREDYPLGWFPQKIFRDKAEFRQWCAVWAKIHPVIQAEKKFRAECNKREAARMAEAATAKAKEVATKKPAPKHPPFQGTLAPTWPWGKKA
jgi:hypothetical protein